MSTELLDATTLEEDCLTSSLLLDFASEEEEITEELDSFAFPSDELDFSSILEEEEETSLPSLEEDVDFSTDEEDLPLSALFCELEEFLETSPLLELVSSQPSLCSSHWRGSGETEEEDSSPHAMKIHAKTSANTNRPKMDCFALTGLAMTFVKIFTEPPVTSNVFAKFS
jgi:hypothetical protein